MRLRNIKNKDFLIENCKLLIKDPKIFKNNWPCVFGNSNKIHLEIGMGKGNYIINMAKKHPDINFIGIEKYTGVVAKAIAKIDNDIPNLRIINIDAKELGEVFGREIDTLYLNFSDPWPKDRHAKRRLTSPLFLEVYDKIFLGDKHIVLKTDNISFFESSIISLSNYGYIFKNISLDLHASGLDNVMTEYEEKFSNLGMKINYLEAIKKDNI